MPNPRAQKPFTLEQVKKDLLSFKEPATALMDMTAGGFRGMAQATGGMFGELEGLGRSAINFGLESAPKNKPYIDRGIQPPQISNETALTNMKDAERHLTDMFGPVIPKDAPNQTSRERSKNYGEGFGQFAVLPGATGAAKLATYGLGRGAGALTRAGLEKINNAHLYGEGALAAVTPQAMAMFGKDSQFFSAADRAAANLKRNKGTGAEFLTELKKTPGVKPAEIEHRNLSEIADMPKMSKEQFLAELNKRPPVQISETVLPEGTTAKKGELAEAYYNKDYYDLSLDQREYIDKLLARYGMDAQGQDYHLPGGENYREVLMQLPSFGLSKMDDLMAAEAMARRNPGNLMLAREVEALKAEKASYGDQYIHSHFGAENPNIVAHVRVQDRKGPNGEKVLHVEEIQSDWHQAGREKGYRGEQKKTDWDDPEYVKARKKATELLNDYNSNNDNPIRQAEIQPLLREAQMAEHAIIDRNNQIEKLVPDAPFKKNWHELATNRLLDYATKNGYDSIAFTPGKEQINRYEDALRKNLDRLDYEPYKDEKTGKTLYELSGHKGDKQVFTKEDVTPEELKELIGKDMLAKIEAGEGRSLAEESPLRPNWMRLEGDNISIGGEGMKGFYDQIIPNYLDKVGKKYGVKTELGGQQLPGAPIDSMEVYGYPRGEEYVSGQITWPEMVEANPELANKFQKSLHNFPITDEMRKDIAENGIPLYAQGGAVHISDNPDTMAMELQDQHFQAGGVVRGLKALKLAMHDPEAIVSSARGATKFAEPTSKTMSVIKEKGGNWLGGNIAGGVDKRLKSLKTNTVAGKTPAERIPMHEELLLNPSINDEGRAIVQRHLDVTRGEDAIDKWIERNVGNYVKKEMGTPEDPVRLMLEKRAGEIEAQFQVDMNRAGRTRARAEAEEDPRRKANLTRQAGREEEQAKFDRDFANEHATHLPKEEYGPNEDALNDLKSKREEAGFAPEGMAKSEPAQRWENLSDEAVDIQFAKNIQKQQELGVKAQQAEEAYRKIGTEIENKYAIEFKKLMDERGVTLTDNEFDRILNSTRMDDKATQLGMNDEFKRLQSEYLQGSKQYNAGLSEIGEENPFVSKLDPETKLYSAYLGDLGIDHVVDVIKQDVAAGRIRPEQLNKLTMDQAVKRTAEFNAEQATKMREAQIKNTEGMPVHKDYGDEGYKWVELKMPEATLPEGYKILPDQTNYKNPGNELFTMFDDQGNAVSTGATEKEALNLYKRQEREQQLADALKYEGDTMGHCVGGYCPDVISGKSKIYSLRDSRGEPHVTVEVNPNQHLDYNDWFKKQPEEIQNKIAQRRVEDKNYDVYESPEYLADREAQPPRIKQIKGKGNARPIEKYDPYTQDFVRSGEWSNVGDLKNTGLIDTQKLLHESVRQKYSEHGIPNPRYMTAEEFDNLPNPNMLQGIEKLPPEGEGMKEGGAVQFSDNPDAMQMELQDKQFGAGGPTPNPNDVGAPSPQNTASPVASFQAGGVVKGLTALKQALVGGSAAAEAAKAARVMALRQSGLSVAEANARVELAAKAAEMKQAMKASEALAKIEGKHLNITQADRTKVGGGYLGGPGFSGLQMQEGPHRDVGAVWGVKNTGTAKTMLGGFDKPLGNEYFTTMIGSPTQHQSNQMVFDKLYKDFTAQAKKGNLDPELHQKINDRLASAVDKDGNAIFPSDIDILSKNFKKQASTFDQRAVAGNVLGGVGVGGKKGQIIDYEKTIRDTTDPFLLDTPSGDLGYRIWTPSGEVIERPDLHPAFPAIATGEDLGVEFNPADKNILLAPFLEKFRVEKGRDPGYMDMTRGRPARVQITEPLLKNLEESGNKAGGAVKAKNKYSEGGAISALMKHAEIAGQSPRMNNQRM